MLSSFKRISPLRIVNSFRKFSKSSGRSCKCVLVGHHNDITMISINRELKRNCLNIETLNQLRDALIAFDNNSEAAVGILHGEGGTFCSGLDIDEILEKGYEPVLEACGSILEGPLCKKPLIAAIDGFAVAEGFELALACDIRVIEDTATLGFIGKRYGAPTLLGGAKRLSDLVGASRALHLLCSAFQINGELANSWGLAGRLVSTGTCIGQALNLATSIAKYPQSSVIHDKLLLYKHLSGNESWLNQNTEIIEEFRNKAMRELEENLGKFKEGIGKHGKFKNVKIKEPLDWEKEI